MVQLRADRDINRAADASQGGSDCADALSPCLLVSLSPCPLVPLSPCPLVPLSPCPLVPLSPCPLVPLSPCPLVPLSDLPTSPRSRAASPALAFPWAIRHRRGRPARLILLPIYP